MADEVKPMTITDAIAELYRVARLVPMNGDEHEKLTRLYSLTAAAASRLVEPPAPAVEAE